jgi:hypothetical protein
MRNCLRIPRQNTTHVRLQPLEQLGIADEAVLYDFAHAARELARRKRVECGRVDEHTSRLVEGSDHVFSEGVVHASFAAH